MSKVRTLRLAAGARHAMFARLLLGRFRLSSYERPPWLLTWIADAVPPGTAVAARATGQVMACVSNRTTAGRLQRCFAGRSRKPKREKQYADSCNQ